MADTPPVADPTDAPTPTDVLEQAKRDFERCQSAESDNRQAFKDDTRFVRAREQWPADIRKLREQEGRPCLTIDKLGPVIRQVVNDARQNKPSIKVHPVDSAADVKTAEVINGLIRNIEATSNADIAYDTAVETAVSGNIGYILIDLDYAFDDSFDLDIKLGRVANPLAVYGDPDSTAGDTSDWNVAFVVEKMSKDAFERRYKNAKPVSWDDSAWANAGTWLDDDGVMVAVYWTREEYQKTIVQTTDGEVLDEEALSSPDVQLGLKTGIKTLKTDKRTGQPLRRVTKCWRVRRRVVTAAEVLENTIWPGRYIPISAVYGDEFWIDGKRYLRSLINGAKDAQQMFNFWRTSGTELVALAPRVPFIGPEGAFAVDAEKWQTVNTRSWPYIQYSAKAVAPPQRQPLDMGAAAGSLQESLNASDDIKAITGIYDASLGARSNETSGRAIMARQREGDVSTFHFIDNMARAIRHVGRIIIDLIPHVYNAERVVRVMGQDGSVSAVQINAPFPAANQNGQPATDPNGQAVMAMHDLTVGKYDLVVDTGPNYTTQRAETADQMMQLLQSFPQAAPVIGDLLVKALDWQGADEIGERLKTLLPPQLQQGGGPSIPPQVQQMVDQGKQIIQQQGQKIQELQSSQAADMAKIQSEEQIQREKIASAERIAFEQQQSNERIALMRTASQPQPQFRQAV